MSNGNNFEATGRITHLAKAAREISATFRVREFVIELEDGNYPQLAKMETTQDKCDLLNDFAVGDEVRVRFNLRGKQTDQGKVFTSLQAWKIDRAGVAPAPQQSAPADAFEEPPF